MAPHQASIFAKPVVPSAADADLSKVCNALAKVQMLTCDNGVITGALKAAALPDEAGWCEYAGTAPPSGQAVCMFVDVKADAIVDNATLLPASTAMSAPAPFSLDLADQERARRAAELVRKRLRYGEPPRSSATEDLR
jgi:hypothetical protein